MGQATTIASAPWRAASATIFPDIRATRSVRVTEKANYKLRSRHLLKDVMFAPKMFLRGKLPLTPHLIQGRDAMKRIFKRTLGSKG